MNSMLQFDGTTLGNHIQMVIGKEERKVSLYMVNEENNKLSAFLDTSAIASQFIKAFQQ